MKTTQWIDKAVELKPDYFDFVSTCLVLAPHPDDETLGCGGLISLLREKDKEVFVLFVTDGSASHPNSKKYGAEELAALRKEEALNALSILNVPHSNAFFFGKKDGALPGEVEPHFEQNANQLHLLIALLHPELILVPYGKDPHPDHRATWQMLMHPNPVLQIRFQILEYLIWLHERGKKEDMPDETKLRFVNITPYLSQKEKAIQQHRSQVTSLIDDDPQGFMLSPEVLSHFTINKEFFVDQSL